jgi:hypothetical protein
MLKVDQYSYVRTARRVYGKKIKQIARETGHSKNTIKKILRGEYIGYKPRVQQPYPILGPYLKIIDKWLEGDKQCPKKQRHTAVRVYNRLKAEHDFQGAETTVRRYVREAKLRLGVSCPQVFIPCDPQVGVEAEADWGQSLACILARMFVVPLIRPRVTRPVSIYRLFHLCVLAGRQYNRNDRLLTRCNTYICCLMLIFSQIYTFFVPAMSYLHHNVTLFRVCKN